MQRNMFGRRIAAIAVVVCCLFSLNDGLADGDQDPLSTARASSRAFKNPYPNIPAQCYVKTNAVNNPCWMCHTSANGRNGTDDWALQDRYEMPAIAKKNHWLNLWRQNNKRNSSALADSEVSKYITTDNYTELLTYSVDRKTYAGWWPDLDFRRGFDAEGFANDSSGWRAIRYKPFPGTFWPTNGSTDETFIRLPAKFREDGSGARSSAIYKLNLSILEASIATPDTHPDSRVTREVEPIDESVGGVDLDGDLRARGLVTSIKALPAHFVGKAATEPVIRYSYPAGTEFLHTVHYVDPNSPNLASVRIKEVRYSVKKEIQDDQQARIWYAREKNESVDAPSHFAGSPEAGFSNGKGWVFQAFIESASGRLRLQTTEEHYYCMGCHRSLGVTVDDTFSFPRKLPGLEGWHVQNLVGQKDVPQIGHKEPEYLIYLERVAGGDEFRSNLEMLRRYFSGNSPIKKHVVEAEGGTRGDLQQFLKPSTERAYDLNRAYMTLVRRQDFEEGRDVTLSDPNNVYKVITAERTGLDGSHRVFKDGRLWLDWPGPDVRVSNR